MIPGQEPQQQSQRERQLSSGCRRQSDVTGQLRILKAIGESEAFYLCIMLDTLLYHWMDHQLVFGHSVAATDV
jgi:hypothetical protein